MNKKRLSVVMAGAMLATSVAPVLAAVEKHEVTHGKMGLFINDLEALMESKKFHATDAEAGKSVYRFQLLRADGSEITSYLSASTKPYKLANGETINVYSDAKVLKDLNATERLDREYTVKVYELGSVERNGGLFSTDKVAAKKATWTQPLFDQLVADVNAHNDKKADTSIANYPGLQTALDNGWIVELEVVKENEKAVKVIVTLGSKDAEGKFNTVECAVGTPKFVFANPVDKDGNLLGASLGNDYIQANIAGFRIDDGEGEKPNAPIAGERAKLLHEVKILNGDMNYTVKVNDLYDGFMLTAKGHELMNAIRACKTESFTEVKSGKGTERFFTVTLTDANGTKHIVKVLGNSLQMEKLNTLKAWLDAEKANVELLAGSNRYATAVEIAKTYLAGDSQYNNGQGAAYAKNTQLVLVNGTALVDGLAAAPYAKAIGAPILLTAEDKLPKETKAYMKELVADSKIGQLNNNDLTVTIVGGESVVSSSVVRELKEIGFKVKRISGDNREETSLAVADKLSALKGFNKAFVVGAEGEADAMSVAAEAAKHHTPIIVAKSAKGLSTVGVNEVAEYNKVEIVGGEGVVPAATADAVKELVGKENVTRLNGKDRYETNALVIKKYHANFSDALIAKDGKANKSELVDALPAAIFASSNADENPAAPIVLATNKISREQLNQLVLNANKSEFGTVYQIGNGVARSVMETVVTKLGLNR